MGESSNTTAAESSISALLSASTSTVTVGPCVSLRLSRAVRRGVLVPVLVRGVVSELSGVGTMPGMLEILSRCLPLRRPKP